MKTGICQICHKEFKLTKSGKLYRHGYKQEIRYKQWAGYFYYISKVYYRLTKQPCTGGDLLPVILQKKKVRCERKI